MQNLEMAPAVASTHRGARKVAERKRTFEKSRERNQFYLQRKRHDPDEESTVLPAALWERFGLPSPPDHLRAHGVFVADDLIDSESSSDEDPDDGEGINDDGGNSIGVLPSFDGEGGDDGSAEADTGFAAEHGDDFE